MATLGPRQYFRDDSSFVFLTAADVAGAFTPAPSANTVFAGPASGAAATPTFRALVPADYPLALLSNSIGGNVPLTVNVEATGPSVAQGVSGIWFASGTVTVGSPSSDNFHCRLWDGTTLIASTSVNNIGGSQTDAALSGVISNPTGNLRISVTNASSSSGNIFAAISGFAKDSTLTVLRIG